MVTIDQNRWSRSVKFTGHDLLEWVVTVDQNTHFGGMEPSDAAKLRELEAENNKLKKLLAEAHLDIHALKSVFSVKR